jgi:hypothetical protein
MRNVYEIGTRSPYPTVRLFIEDDIILLGVEVVLSGLTTHWMMPWTLWPSGAKRHTENCRGRTAGHRETALQYLAKPVVLRS